jgi:hypothetical protein
MLSQVLNHRLANHIGSRCGLSIVLLPLVSQAVQSIPNIDWQINLNAGVSRADTRARTAGATMGWAFVLALGRGHGLNATFSRS